MRKRAAAYGLDLLMLLFSWLCLRCLPDFIPSLTTPVLIAVLAAETILLTAIELTGGKGRRKQKRKKAATVLMLLNEAERAVRTWPLEGEISLVIGRDLPDGLPGIDLADTEYSALIDAQHAVLNFTAAGWVVEDLRSKNGVSIQRPGNDAPQRIAPGVPYRITPGDILLIAGDTRIAVN